MCKKYSLQLRKVARHAFFSPVFVGDKIKIARFVRVESLFPIEKWSCRSENCILLVGFDCFYNILVAGTLGKVVDSVDSSNSIKGEALRLLRTNSSKTEFKAKISQFKAHLTKRGYPETLFSAILSEIKNEDRKLALQKKCKENTRILPFVTQYRPTVPNLKQILMQKWHLIQQ